MERIVKGAYDPQLLLESGKIVGLTKYLTDFVGEVNAVGKDAIVINRRINPVLTYVNSPADEAWFTAAPGQAGIAKFYVPTLAELGLEAAATLQAKIELQVADPSETADPIEVRLLDSNDQPVAGSLGQGNASGTDVETTIASDFFTIEPGAIYTFDARKLNVNETFIVQFASWQVLVRKAPAE